MGMKNHELVPTALVATIANIRHGGVQKKLRALSDHRLVAYERGKRCKFGLLYFIKSTRNTRASLRSARSIPRYCKSHLQCNLSLKPYFTATRNLVCAYAFSRHA